MEKDDLVRREETNDRVRYVGKVFNICISLSNLIVSLSFNASTVLRLYEDAYGYLIPDLTLILIL